MSQYRGGRRWIAISCALALLVLVVASSLIAGFALHRYRRGPYHLLAGAVDLLSDLPIIRHQFAAASESSDIQGRWRPVSGLEESDPDVRRAIAELEAIGYLAGTREQTGSVGIITVQPESEGLNLICSAHGPEALLMDMRGEIVHRWRLPYDQAFGEETDDFRSEFWRKVHLSDNGDLLAIFEGLGIVKLDKHSNLLWARKNGSHHDMHVAEDGTIFVLTRTARIVPTFNPRRPVLEDFISVLDPDGRELARYSLLEAVQRSRFASLLGFAEKEGDIFHTNSLRLLDGRSGRSEPFLKPGNALVSLSGINTVAVVDLDVNEVVWALAGMFEYQHDPSLTPAGNVLVFDNKGHRGLSRVVEIDPLSQAVVWSFADELFFSRCCGTSQRLDNGNTLITESERGRAIEVTPGGAVVWDYRSPFRAGDDNELVATLFEVSRLENEHPLGWLEAAAAHTDPPAP